MGYVSPGKSDMELLFGVLGGGSVSGQSGTLIKEQLNQLVGELNNAKNTNERKLRFTVDTANSKVEFRKKLTTIVNDIGSTNNFEVKITKIDASSAITQLRDDINDALKMLKVDTGFDVSVNADGSKSAIKQIAADAEEAIEKSARLKASIEEVERTRKSLDKSYDTAKNILGGENATGDDLTTLTAIRDKYIEMTSALEALKEKQKNGSVVSDVDIDKVREFSKETQNSIDAVLARADAETEAAKVAEEAEKARQKAAEESAKAAEAARKAEEKSEKEKSAAKTKEDKAKELEDLKKRVALLKEIAAENEKLKKAFETAEGREGTKIIGTDEYTDTFKKVRDDYNRAKESVEAFNLEVKSVSDPDLPEMNALKDAKEKLDDASKAVDTFNRTLIPRSTEYNTALGKTDKLLSNIKDGEEGWTKAKEGKSATDYSRLKGYGEELEKLRNDLESGALSAEEFSKRFDNVNSQFKASSAAIKAAGENTKTFGERLAALAEKFSKWLTVSQVIMFLVRQVKKMITTVIELDDAMTELKKVTDETDAAYEKFFKNASKRAKELGATLKDTINATASFARLGYDITDASALADAAVIYNNVGDEIESIDDASQSIISTMQAFGVEAQNVMTIVDKFNEVGKSLPKSIVICWAKALLVAISVKGQRWLRPSKDFVVLIT